MPYDEWILGKQSDWQFKARAGFFKSILTDSMRVILNETALKFIGLKKPYW